MLKNKHQVSIVILTYNGISHIPDLFESIKMQTINPEIIVIDSGSTDGTNEYLFRNFNDIIRHVAILKKDFNHGSTRNLGLELTTNEIVVYITQDVILKDENSLENLIKPLLEEELIAISYGRQLAKKDATVLSEFSRLNNYPGTSIIKSIEDAKKLGIKTCFLSNSFSAYKKTVLKQIGVFPSHTILCEDVYVGGKALLKGYKIAYASDALIYHSHNYSIIEEFKRYFDIGFFYNSESWIFQNFSKAESEGLKYINKELKLLIVNKYYVLLPEFMIRNFFKFFGYKLGKYANHLPLFIKKKLSMHSYFWRY